MSPQLAAGLTALVGICMVAGWVTAFRNRAYLGLLGLAFLALSGFLWTGGKARVAGEMELGDPQMLLLARALLAACLVLFLLAALAAARETTRRVHEIRSGYREAEGAMLEMVKASLEKEKKAEAEPSHPEDASEEKRE
ncbi:MAG: hypothetical protein OEV33_00445 [Armatimonadota bacterium]|nr:hypothetical protein [Armatimonadota bacterium]